MLFLRSLDLTKNLNGQYTQISIPQVTPTPHTNKQIFTSLYIQGSMTVLDLCCIFLISILIKSWKAWQTRLGRTITWMTGRGSTAHVSSNLPNLPEEEEEEAEGKPCLCPNAVMFMLTCNNVGGCCWGGFCAIFYLLWTRRVPAYSPLWSVWVTFYFLNII